MADAVFDFEADSEETIGSKRTGTGDAGSGVKRVAVGGTSEEYKESLRRNTKQNLHTARAARMLMGAVWVCICMPASCLICVYGLAANKRFGDMTRGKTRHGKGSPFWYMWQAMMQACAKIMLSLTLENGVAQRLTDHLQALKSPKDVEGVMQTAICKLQGSDAEKCNLAFQSHPDPLPRQIFHAFKAVCIAAGGEVLLGPPPPTPLERQL